jgi:sporulation protein YlmC with PRC-barrel domain
MGRRLVRLGLGAAAVSVTAVALGLLAAPHGAKRSPVNGGAESSIAETERQSSPRAFVSAGALAGRAVHDADGREAGALASFLADTRTGRVPFVVIDRRPDSDPPPDEDLVLPSAMLHLSAAPAGGPVPLRAADAAARDAAAPASDPDPTAREREPVDKPRQALVPILDLRGATVRTPFGETLGRVEDIVLDHASPEPSIAYVTVIRDSGDRTNAIALPFEACAWRTAEKRVLVVADASTLKAAPVVAADRPASLDEMQVAALRRAFGY